MPEESMQEVRAQLDPARVAALDEVLAAQSRESLEWLRDIDSQLTRNNFITNGGAAVAVLAFIGTGHAPTEMLWPLGFFTAGVLATGIELRALAVDVAALHSDASRRRRGFANGELKVLDLLVPPNLAKWPKRINRWASITAQLSFAIGVVVAVVLFICAGIQLAAPPTA
jgi:hypothetical protein